MCRKWKVLAVSAAMIASPALTFTGTAAGVDCAEALKAPHRLHIQFIPYPGVTEIALAEARVEMEQIWARYGVEFVWSVWSRTSMASNSADVLTVQFVEMPAPTADKTAAVAWVHFVDGKPLSNARVSLTMAKRILAGGSYVDGRPWKVQTVDVQQVGLGRIIGRALAHEIGHFLFAWRGHADSGLMSANIHGDLMVGPGRAFFKLDRSRARELRAARLTMCETTLSRAAEGTR